MKRSTDLSIIDLPFECLYIIFSYVTGNDILSLRKVCTIFAEVAMYIKNYTSTIFYPTPTNVVYNIYNIVLGKPMILHNINRNHKIKCVERVNDICIYNGAGSLTVDNIGYNSGPVDIDNLSIKFSRLTNIRETLLNVKKLTMYNNATVNAIEYLPNMISLKLTSEYIKIKRIQRMESLTKLNVDENVLLIRELSSLKKLVCNEKCAVDFSTLPKLEYLNITNIRESYPLPYISFPYLKVLKLRNHRDIDINYIASITTLEELDLFATNITDVSRLTHVKKLNISYTNVTDISMLTEVEELDISYTDIINLPANNKIRILKADGYKGIHLNNIEKVVRLNITNSMIESIPDNKIEWIRADRSIYLVDISNLHHATFIDVHNTKVSQLPSPNVIKEIIIWGSRITSLNGLENAEIVDSSYNKITELPNFTNIKKLYINGCNKIDHIPYYSHITHLYINSTLIREVNHLTTLTHLIANVSDVRRIDKLTNLLELEGYSTLIKVPSSLTKLVYVRGIDTIQTDRMNLYEKLSM